MKKVLKISLYVFLGFLGLLLLLVLLHPFILGPAIKAGVVKIGPTITKTPITLTKVHVNLFTGNIELQGLKIANPEGFKTEAVMKVGVVKISLAPLSVFTGKIHVKQVLVDGAEAWYEMGIPDSNVGKLQKNVDEFTASAGKPAGSAKPTTETAQPATKPAKPAAKPGKKVVIDDLQILNTKMHMSIKGIGGGDLPIPLPNIKQKDLGKEGDGKSIGQMCGDVLKSIFGGISDAASAGGKMIGSGAKAVGGAATDAGKAVGGAIKGLFGGGK